jgi:hypothetical protein
MTISSFQVGSGSRKSNKTIMMTPNDTNPMSGALQKNWKSTVTFLRRKGAFDFGTHAFHNEKSLLDPTSNTTDERHGCD